jgi:hypothetical protein
MHSLLTISCYFGKLPEHFPMFLKSVEMNPTVDFLLITDCKVDDMPSNFRVYNCSFEEMRERIQALFDFSIVLDRPYKLCDYKPVWGLAFSEYLEEYDFWGYCDLDMIFGDIRAFLPDSVLDNHDKIYKLGHLTYYRNNDENNARYRIDNWLTYKEAFTTSEIVAFDEIAGMQNIFDQHGFSTYISRDYADITYGKVRFTLSYFQIPEELVPTNNYDKQVFYWENGKVFRAYLKDGEILREEFIYIHFSKRKMLLNDVDENSNTFYITNKGLFAKNEIVGLNEIDFYNRSKRFQEIKRFFECWSKNKKIRIKYYYKLFLEKIK